MKKIHKEGERVETGFGPLDVLERNRRSLGSDPREWQRPGRVRDLQ